MTKEDKEGKEDKEDKEDNTAKSSASASEAHLSVALQEIGDALGMIGRLQLTRGRNVDHSGWGLCAQLLGQAAARIMRANTSATNRDD